MKPLVAVLAVLAFGACSRGVTCDIDAERSIVVGTEPCAQPCTVDFGDVVVPLAETRRVVVLLDSEPHACVVPGFFTISPVVAGGGPFTFSQGAGESDAFAQVQLAPEAPGDYAATLTFNDDFGDDVDIELAGRGVVP